MGLIATTVPSKLRLIHIQIAWALLFLVQYNPAVMRVTCCCCCLRPSGDKKDGSGWHHRETMIRQTTVAHGIQRAMTDVMRAACVLVADFCPFSSNRIFVFFSNLVCDLVSVSPLICQRLQYIARDWCYYELQRRPWTVVTADSWHVMLLKLLAQSQSFV
jgi:hypothetical protein